MMWDMTWNLVILAWAFMALGVLLLEPRLPGDREAGLQRGISKMDGQGNIP